MAKPMTHEQQQGLSDLFQFNRDVVESAVTALPALEKMLESGVMGEEDHADIQRLAEDAQAVDNCRKLLRELQERERFRP